MSRSLERETAELVEHLESKRRRRKVRRALLVAMAAAALVAAITAGAVLAGAGGDGQTAGLTISTRVPSSGSVGTQPAFDIPSSGDVATTVPDTVAGLAGVSATATTSAVGAPPTSTTTWLEGKVVAIDPGHQAHANGEKEPIGPGSSTKKAKVSSGTSNRQTGTPESEVNLAIGLKLRDALTDLGIQVVMTRTSQEVDVPNSRRAQIANEARAALAVRLHCNGSGDASVHGLFTLYPASIPGWTDDIAAASKSAAEIIQREAIAATGATDRGLQKRSDITGFNWSDVPVVLVEMGFMSNRGEGSLLESGTYQDKIVRGLVDGIVEFLRTE